MPSLGLMLVAILAYGVILLSLAQKVSGLEDRLSGEPKDAIGFRDWSDEDEDDYADKR